MAVTGASGQSYTLNTKPFSSGGEGDIYTIPSMPDKVVKIYHPDRVSRELEAKLTLMTKRPPSSTVLNQVAWPLDVVYDMNRRFCGFVMPKLDINCALSDIYVYPPKSKITYKHKLIIAQNICAVINAVHKAGYIFGDFNPKNIGINTQTGRVAFLDTDSYHIVLNEAEGKAFRCKVCMDGYVAPELLKKCEAYPKDAYATAPLPTFTRETDNFALAIHIFKLLMNGYTPFNGIKETETVSTGSPGVNNQAIKRDSYCFKPGNKPQAVAVPPLEALPEDVANLFTRAFMYGRLDPKQRPSAAEWYKSLNNYEKQLVTCSKNPMHLYKQGLQTCPWCEADERYALMSAPVIPQRSFSQPVSPGAPPPITGTTPNANVSGTILQSQYTNFTPSTSSTPQAGYVSAQPAGAGNRGTTFNPPQRQSAANAISGLTGKTKLIIAGVALLILIMLVNSCAHSGGSKKKNSSSSTPTTTQTAVTASSNKWNTNKEPTITSGIEVESNDSYTSANPVAVNSTFAGSLKGTYSNEQDWYTFTLDSEGIVSIAISTNQQKSSNGFWDVSLRAASDPSAMLWQTYIKGSDTRTESGAMVLPAGTYYVEIESSDQYSADPYEIYIGYSQASILAIPSIGENPVQIPEIEIKGTTVQAATVDSFSGTIYSSGQVDDHWFTAERDGVYHFELANIPEGYSYYLYLNNSGGNYITGSRYENGRGFSKTLTAGESYNIQVKGGDYTGNYTVLLGRQTPPNDANGYQQFHDSIVFRDQENCYVFTAPYSGDYYFGLTDVAEGYRFNIQLYNAGGNWITGSNYSNGRGPRHELTQGQQYTVKVVYADYLGDYTLTIWPAKPQVDVSPYTKVFDSIQHTGQVNVYTYKCSHTGSHYFGMLGIPEGYRYGITVLNSGGSQLRSSNCTNDNGFRVDLTSGETYTIKVSEADYVGNYTLVIGAAKETVDISSYDAVLDSLQYNRQDNVYMLTASQTGEYRFRLSGLPADKYCYFHVFNSGGNRLADRAMKNNEEYKVSLQAGETYSVDVEYNDYLGSYTLSILR